ncbi:MAG: hypothetical protein HY700_20465 [Gemmatimonadetes bacterium]|nr:hypothetical protein [Gemmatimonadota bacterium]
MTGTALPGVTDLHAHIQPWGQMKPAPAEVVCRGKEQHWERVLALMDDPGALLDVLDSSSTWPVGLINAGEEAVVPPVIYEFSAPRHM